MALTPEERIQAFKTKRKNSHLMMVDGFSMLLEHEIGKCKSSVFEYFGYKWRLILYPRGISGEDDFISLYLKIMDLPKNRLVKVDFTLFILFQRELLSNGFDYTDVSLSSSKPRQGKKTVRTHEQFFNKNKGYYEKDSAIFGVEIRNVECSLCNTPRIMGTAERLELIENPPNNKFTWKITRFSTFNQKKHSSYEFRLGGRKWRIMIYPKGDTEVEGEWFSAYLKMSDYSSNPTKTLVKFKLRVLDQIYKQHREHENVFWVGELACGASEFISLKELHDPSNGYLVNDMIYIGIEFQLISITHPM